MIATEVKKLADIVRKLEKAGEHPATITSFAGTTYDLEWNTYGLEWNLDGDGNAMSVVIGIDFDDDQIFFEGLYNGTCIPFGFCVVFE